MNRLRKLIGLRCTFPPDTMGGTVTATGVGRHKHPASSERAWNIDLLAETEPGRRNRRTIDSVFLLLASVVLGLSAAVASAAPRQDHEVGDALRTVFGWAGGFWDAAFISALVLALAVVVDVLWRRRLDLVRDLLVAGVCLAGTAVVIGGVVVSDWIPSSFHLSRLGLPRPAARRRDGGSGRRRAGARRSVRLLAFWLVPLAALGAIVVDAALLAVLAALALALASRGRSYASSSEPRPASRRPRRSERAGIAWRRRDRPGGRSAATDGLGGVRQAARRRSP